MKLNYFQGNIVKCISLIKGNKIEDLEKAKHYCELAMDFDKGDNILKQIFFRLFIDKKKVNKSYNIGKLTICITESRLL